ncbi:MAG: GNAT family N-acetyltransferase [Planctomycetota bacterium]|jgi:ribosomal-protein-alanine N-acetyltransferase
MGSTADDALQRDGARVLVRPLELGDEAAFIEASQRSRELHRPWASPPDNPAAFRTLLGRTDQPNFAAFVALERAGGELCGAFNLSEIVRGAFQSSYLGYQAFAPWAGQGLMGEALELLLEIAFDGLDLHRVEANVQPGNVASIALVRGRGFRQEGFSPRYLKIGGEWRDHERWALLEEDWRARGRLR